MSNFNFFRTKTTILFCLILSTLMNAQEVKKETFKKQKIKLTNSLLLDIKLKETSGLIHWNGKLWTHNDDTDTNLYALDTLNGSILETYSLSNVVNQDWEEIAQDDSFVYLGDFGNNASGNRQNLNILKIDKSSLINKVPKIEYIKFKYENQNEFDHKKPNNTNFDCEAFVVTKDSIYLFTKEWKTNYTTVYTLPKTSGEYIAKQKEVFNVKGLVTGACLFENRLVLCGYTKRGRPFIDLFYDFKGNDFFSGSHKKIKIKPRFLQIEAITTKDGKNYYLTNEELKFGPIHNSQQMHQLDFSGFFNAN